MIRGETFLALSDEAEQLAADLPDEHPLTALLARINDACQEAYWTLDDLHDRGLLP